MANEWRNVWLVARLPILDRRRAAGCGSLTAERFGQWGGAIAARQVALMLGSYTANVLAQRRLDRFGKHRAPILAAFAMTDDDH
jgi:hypothetical protein